MKAIVLAAGYATRLYPLTEHKAKALLPVCGKPIINYIANQIETIPDVNEIIVVSNHKFYDQFKKWAETYQSMNRQISLTVIDDGTVSEDDRLGAIGDIQFCIEKCAIDEDLVIIAGDNLFTYQLFDAWQSFRQAGADMILGKKMPEADDLSRYAIAQLDDKGFIVDLEEKPDKPKSDIAVFATYFYLRSTLPLIKDYLDAGLPPDSPGRFPAWLYRKKPIKLYLFDGICIDIGTPQSYEDVRTTFPHVLESRTKKVDKNLT